jgi:hypothetical protein
MFAQREGYTPVWVQSEDVPWSIPRDVLTARLERLLRRIGARPEYVTEYRGGPLDGATVEGAVRVRIEGIWTFGSYARGARACGDLDLIVRTHKSWIGPLMVDGRPAEGFRLLPSLDSVFEPFAGALRNMEVVEHYFFVRGKTVHLSTSRSQVAHSAAALTGQATETLTPLR